MSIPVRIESQGREVAVTKLGQLVTASVKYDEVSALEVDANNTAFNIFLPIVGQQFVLTTILLTSTGVTGSAIIDIYEADAIDSITITKSILHVDLRKNEFRDLTQLNLLITPGVYLNVKADDNTVDVSLMGYYIPVV